MRWCSSTSPSAHTRACFSACSSLLLGHAERRTACAMSPPPWTGKRATYRSRTATVGLSDLIGCVVGERQPPAVGVSIVAGLATISTRALGAVVFTAEVLGSGIWCGCCNPRTTRHETEELRLEVLNIRH